MRALALAVVTLVAVVLGACTKAPPVRVIAVGVSWPGASAEAVERGVTMLLEDALAGVVGAESTSSTSTPGDARVLLRLAPKADEALALEDTRARLTSIASRLPADASPPIITRTVADARPALRFVVTSDLSRREATVVLEALRRRVEAVPGVARAVIDGAAHRELQIDVDRARAAAFGLTPIDVADAVRASLQGSAPGATLSARGTEVTVESLARTPLRTEPAPIGRAADAMVRLADVAIVVDGVRALPDEGTIRSLHDAAVPPLDDRPRDAREKAAPLALTIWPHGGASVADVQTGTMAALAQASLPAGFALAHEPVPARVDLSLVVTGADREQLAKVAAELEPLLRRTEGVVDVVGPPAPRPERRLVIDHERAAALGVSVGDVARTAALALEGELVHHGTVAVDVRVRVDGDREAMGSHAIRARDGSLRTLQDVASEQAVLAPVVLERVDRSPAHALCASVRGRDLALVRADVEKVLTAAPMPAGIVVRTAACSPR